MKKKILYAVAGEGRGHAGRALAIAEQMEKDVDFYFICGGKAYQLFAATKHNVFEIPFLGFIYEHDSISLLKTLLFNLKLFFNRNKIYKQINEHINKIKPDFIMSDFEYFVPRATKKLGIPVIQISHQHILVACKYKVPFSQMIDFIKAYIVTKFILIKSEYEFAISFYKLPLTGKYAKKNLPIFPPLLRKEVVTAKPSVGEKVLVYFSCDTFAWVMKILKEIKNESFVVYGIRNKHEIDSNIEYKPISPTTFLDDLKISKCVITNGGHGLVSEAVYLKKPVLAFYVKGQFEQYLNAFYLDKLHFGKMIKSDKNALAELKEFFSELPELTQQICNSDIYGNDLVCNHIKSIISEEI